MATVSIPNIPVGTNYPWPSQQYELPDVIRDYHFSGTLHYDSPSFTQLVLFFHGSGNAALTGNLLNALLSLGYGVLSADDFGVRGSSESPWRYNYGSSTAPPFMSSWLRNGWWVRSVVEYALGPLRATYDVQDIVIAGQSRGATAALAYGGGYTGLGGTPPSAVRGIFAAGATGGASESIPFSWNDVNRNIATMSTMVGLNGYVPTIMAYGDADTLAPPDYVKRVQLVLPENAGQVYIVSPGNAPHTWIESATFYPCAAMWIQQLMEGLTITDRTGAPAVPGSIAA